MSPRLRSRSVVGRRMWIALREHVDPGPELRARTDRQARYFAGLGWIAWAAMVGQVAIVAGGRWNRPALAAPGAVLVLAAGVGWTWWVRQLRADARSWLADPPGPARDPLPTTLAERWLTGRRVVVLFGAVVGLAVVAGLVAALAVRR